MSKLSNSGQDKAMDPVDNQEAGFVHLHCHSEYSSLDGGSQVKNMAAALKARGMAAMALTDHGVMQGLPQFYDALRDEGIKPILGIEAYLTDDRFDKTRGTPTYHLTLLAETTEGYHNLCKLSSQAFIDGAIMTFGRARARADWELLERYSKGVIAFTGCMAAPVMAAIFKGDVKKARENTERLIKIYGKDNVYGEIQNVGITVGIPGDSELAKKLQRAPLTKEEAAKYVEVEEGEVPLSQTDANRCLVEICNELQIKYLATGDVHYLDEKDANPHDAMICIGTGQLKNGSRRFSLLPKKYHLRTEEEMLEAVSEWPESLTCTLEVAKRCNAEITYGRELLPRFPLPEGFDSSQTYLRSLCEAGLDERYGHGSQYREEAEERLAFELDVINDMGFNDYFLIVWDLFNEANKRSIPSGPGRGSAAGSIVAYSLDITKLCPLEHKLLFERFLNPGRRSMPDIDMDFGVKGREELILYAKDKYNDLAGCQTTVAQIVTFGKFKAKGALRDAARVMAEPSDDGRSEGLKLGDRLSRLIPDDPSSTMRSVWDDKKEGESLRKAHKQGGKQKEAIELAGWLEGFVRSNGIHAAAVLIADHDLTNDLPLQQFGPEKPLHVQYDMHYSEKLGLLKMDFLGLRNLDIIYDAVERIRHTQRVEIDPYNLPLDDAETFALLSRAESVGLFQLESSGMQGALKEVMPSEFNDVIALVALYRPGPMQNIPVYAARKHGREQVSYPDMPDEMSDKLSEILQETMGIIIYQEQSMIVARQMANFSPSQADDLRKAIGKKLRDKMDELKKPFYEGCKANGLDKDSTDWLWDSNEKSADYSFNKCLSADTKIRLADGQRVRVSELYSQPPQEIMSMWPNGEVKPHRVKKIVKTGNKPLYRVVTESGKQIKITMEHRLLTSEGYLPLSDLKIGTELITVPVYTDQERASRSARMKEISRRPERKQQDARASERMRKYQAGRPLEEKIAHMKSMHEKHPGLTNNGVQAMHEKVAWLRANNPEWVKNHAKNSFAAVRATYDNGPGFGHCSIASNDMWCASNNERNMCEWLIESGVDFEMHKVLGNGRISDFYFAGVYWEMDGMDRSPEFFSAKYDNLPFVVVTPEDYRAIVSKHLGLEHAENGDPIVRIESVGNGSTFDIEMERGGPLNFIANNIVSHNSHAACYGLLAYITAYLKAHYPNEYMASLLTAVMGDKDKPRLYLTEAKRMGLEVLPPDINRSLKDFAVLEREDNPGEWDILFGLTALRGVGSGVVSEMKSEREARGPFLTMFDLIRRMPHLNKTVIQSLAKGGALDQIGGSRKGMHDEVEGAIKRIRKEHTSREREFARSIIAHIETEAATQTSLFGVSAAGKQTTKLTPLNKKGVDAGAVLGWKEKGMPDEELLTQAIEDGLSKEHLRLFRAAARQQIKEETDEVAGIAAEESGESDKEKVERIAADQLADISDDILNSAGTLLPLVAAAIEAEWKKRGESEMIDAVLEGEIDPVLPADEWEDEEKLRLERKTLGTYVSGHPLDVDRRAWARYVSDGLGNIDDTHIGQTLRVVGVVTSIAEIKMRNGEILRRVSVEDLTGSREIIIFPRTLEGGLDTLLCEDKVVCFEVGVMEDTFTRANEESEESEDNETKKAIKLQASRLYRWEPNRVSEEIHPVNIEISQDHFNLEWVTRLRAVCAEHPGDNPVRLVLDGQGHKTELLVKPSDDLIREIKQLLED